MRNIFELDLPHRLSTANINSVCVGILYKSCISAYCSIFNLLWVSEEADLTWQHLRVKEITNKLDGDSAAFKLTEVQNMYLCTKEKLKENFKLTAHSDIFSHYQIHINVNLF